MNLFKERGDVTIHKHHRKASVYTQGRYLHVDMKISLKGKRDREIAVETAREILRQVGITDATGKSYTNDSDGKPIGHLSTDTNQ